MDTQVQFLVVTTGRDEYIITRLVAAKSLPSRELGDYRMLVAVGDYRVIEFVAFCPNYLHHSWPSIMACSAGKIKDKVFSKKKSKEGNLH